MRFRLTNDLGLATEPNFYCPYLAGEFDGNGYKISDLSFNFGLVSQVGLFGYLASNGRVHDVAAEGVNIAACVCVGGLVGVDDGTVSNSYSTGNVIGESLAGGLMGQSNIGESTISSSFWDIETSGQAISDGGTGKTTAEMMDIAIFSGVGWDITTVADPSTRDPAYIWNIVHDETYPFLNWQP